MLVTDAQGRIVGNEPTKKRLADQHAWFPKDANLSNSALLVIDMMRSCAAEEYEKPEHGIRFSRICAMVPRLCAFVSSFREAGGLAIFVKTVPWTERNLPDNINELYRNDESVRYWSDDETGRPEELYGLPSQGVLVFEKNTYDAFTNEDLNQALVERGIRYVLFAGAFGDACVHASIGGGFSRGFHPVIAERPHRNNRRSAQAGAPTPSDGKKLAVPLRPRDRIGRRIKGPGDRRAEDRHTFNLTVRTESKTSSARRRASTPI